MTFFLMNSPTLSASEGIARPLEYFGGLQIHAIPSLALRVSYLMGKR